MGYGCQRDFHIEDFVESFRHTSPAKRAASFGVTPSAVCAVRTGRAYKGIR